MTEKIEKWLWVYMAGELVLLILIKLSDAGLIGAVSYPLQFAAVAVNFFVACLFLVQAKAKPDLIWLGLLFTLAADFFLALLDTCYPLGVLLFCVVQTVYACKIGWTKARLALRITVFAAVVVVLSALRMNTLINLLSGYSITMLLLNALFSLINAKADGYRADLLFCLGLFLFLGCDICVGLKNLLPGETVGTTAGFLIWIFYIPSQVCIVLSEREKIKKSAKDVC